jgi:hypothetical protein
MPRIGITGHMNLSSDTLSLVRNDIRDRLSAFPVADLIGLSCIAPGADSVFAEVILAVGGRLEVVLPARDYPDRKVKPEDAGTFDQLIADAQQIHVMDRNESNRAAYEAANRFMLESIDQMFAVWDGLSPAHQGGTGAAVAQARDAGIPVEIIWPRGASRLA